MHLHVTNLFVQTFFKALKIQHASAQVGGPALSAAAACVHAARPCSVRKLPSANAAAGRVQTRSRSSRGTRTPPQHKA
eukprot:268249-Chlamydomonas_euryale.AAC.1